MSIILAGNNILLYVLVGVSGLILLFVIISIIIYAHGKRINKKIEQNSPYVQTIKEVNAKYSFATLPTHTFVETFYLNSKKQFDNFNYRKKGVEFFVKNSAKFVGYVNTIETNKKLQKQYIIDLNKIEHKLNPELAELYKIKPNVLFKKESEIVGKLIKKPITSFSFKIKWEYTSPAGQNHYSDSVNFTYEFIKSLMDPYIRVKEEPAVSSTSTSSRIKEEPKEVVTIDDIEAIDD